MQIVSYPYFTTLQCRHAKSLMLTTAWPVVRFCFHLTIFCIDHRLGVWLEGRTETGIQLDDLEPEASLKPL